MPISTTSCDRLAEQRILVGIELVVVALPSGLRRRSTSSSRSSRSSGSPWRAQNSVSFAICGLVDVGALDALQLRRADRREQHVALAEQRLGAVLVEDHARVGLRADTAKAIRDGTLALIMPVMTSTRGRLRREHEVDADRARLLREADDRVLDVGRRDHHQVGELVDHAEDVRQRLVLVGDAGGG